MRFWQRGLLILLGTGPLGLIGWLGVLWIAPGASQFPLETALRDDPRSPSSLNYALRKVADANPAPVPAGVVHHATGSLFGHKAESPAAGGGDGLDGKSPEQLIAEIAALPPEEGSRRAVAVLAKIPPEQAQAAIPLFLGYLRDNATPSRELAQTLLSHQLGGDVLERMPNDESWRLLYAGLLWQAFQRLWSDPSSVYTTWQSKITDVNDPLWHRVFQSFVPTAPPIAPEAVPASPGEFAVQVPVTPGADPLESLSPAPAPMAPPPPSVE